MVQENFSNYPHILILDRLPLIENMPIEQLDTRWDGARAQVHPLVVVIMRIHEI